MGGRWGRAWAWMGMGSVMPALRSISRMRPDSPHWFQLFTGLGTSFPRTCGVGRPGS